MPKPTPPKQFKDPADFTVAELAEAQAARARGETYKPETKAFKIWRNAVLEAGGLEPDRDVDDETAREDESVEDAVERMKGWRP